jgi:hypothetical protein
MIVRPGSRRHGEFRKSVGRPSSSMLVFVTGNTAGIREHGHTEHGWNTGTRRAHGGNSRTREHGPREHGPRERGAREHGPREHGHTGTRREHGGNTAGTRAQGRNAGTWNTGTRTGHVNTGTRTGHVNTGTRTEHGHTDGTRNTAGTRAHGNTGTVDATRNTVKTRVGVWGVEVPGKTTTCHRAAARSCPTTWQRDGMVSVGLTISEDRRRHNKLSTG